MIYTFISLQTIEMIFMQKFAIHGQSLYHNPVSIRTILLPKSSASKGANFKKKINSCNCPDSFNQEGLWWLYSALLKWMNI